MGDGIQTPDTTMDKQPEVITYILSVDSKGCFFFCNRCQMRSYNRNDIDNHYCGHCKVFHDDIWPPARKAWLGIGTKKNQ